MTFHEIPKKAKSTHPSPPHTRPMPPPPARPAIGPPHATAPACLRMLHPRSRGCTRRFRSGPLKQNEQLMELQNQHYTVLSGSSFIFVNWKIHVYLLNFQCILAGLYFYVYIRGFQRLYNGFNLYRLFVFIFQFIFLCGNIQSGGLVQVQSGYKL